MAKHIVTPATAEEIGRALGVTRKDREIVERALREIGEYETEPSPRSRGHLLHKISADQYAEALES
jgi:hypothetical protein